MISLIHKSIDDYIKDITEKKLDYVQVINYEHNIYFLLMPKMFPYRGGYYIGKIILPDDYSKQTADFIMLTPNGKFFIGDTITIKSSDNSKEKPWDLKIMFDGFISIFLDKNTYTKHPVSYNRKKGLAQNSIKYNCENHKDIFTKFYLFVEKNGTLCKDLKKQKKISHISNPEPIYESDYIDFYEEDYDLEGYTGPKLIIKETDPAMIHKSYLKFLKRKSVVITERSYEDQFNPFIVDYDNF
jgi:hypothetical protein